MATPEQHRPAPKRSRRSSSRRPAPPPPPPDSLVQLLQQDASVLHYFQSLQASLDADVQIWKDRAAKLAREKKQLEEQLVEQQQPKKKQQQPKKKQKQQQQQPPPATPQNKKQKKQQQPAKNSSAHPTTTAAAAANERNNNMLRVEEHEEQHPIDDDMFEIGSSSSSCSHDTVDDDEKQGQPTATTQNQQASNVLFELASSDDDDDDDERKLHGDDTSEAIEDSAVVRPQDNTTLGDDDSMEQKASRLETLRLLGVAYESFQKLGIALVVVETLTVDDDDAPVEEEVNVIETTPNPQKRQGGSANDADNNNSDDATSVSSNEMTFLRHDERPRQSSMGPPNNETAAAAAATASCTSASRTVQTKKAPHRSTIHRRSDRDVTADILNAVKDLTQLYKLLNVDEFPLFDPETLIPCCNTAVPSTAEAHDDDSAATGAVVEGKRHLFRALVLVDTLCSSFLSDDEWNAIFESSDKDDVNESISSLDHQQQQRYREIKIGLKHRKTLVDDLIQSLHNDIADSWAVADRSRRHTTSGLHFSINHNDDAATITTTAAASTSTLVDESKNTSLIIGASRSLVHLARMAERCLLAQLVVGLYLARDDTETAMRLVMKYVISTTPAPLVEDYPRLAPVMSLLVLESLLWPDSKLFWWKEEEQQEEGSWFLSAWYSKRRQGGLPSSVLNTTTDLLLRVLSLSMHAAACIYKARIASTDDRIHDTALVEYECFRRICRKKTLSWMDDGLLDMDEKEAALNLWGGLLYHDNEFQALCESSGPQGATWTLELALLLGCEKAMVKELAIKCMSKWPGTTGKDQCCLLAVTRVMRGLIIRELDPLLHAVGVCSNDCDYTVPDVTSYCQLAIDSMSSQCLNPGDRIDQLMTVMESASFLGDGSLVLDAAKALVRETGRLEDLAEIPQDTIKDWLDSFRTMAQVPVVRVINLERRKDRMNAFMAQALLAGMLVVRALGDMAENDSSNGKEVKGFEFGGYALDGRGRMAEAQGRLAQAVGSLSLLNKLVTPDWRPNDLKPFDRDAPDHENLVLTTASERACALSHICSWKGALRSMELHKDLQVSEPGRGLFRHPANIIRLFKISGFAEGPALLHQNETMAPAPVCLILEDDAILVDRFVDRLKALLKELPRDFHFCSLGYSRPKTAPMVSCSSLVGIPSMLWYLTGYVISAQGAQYLLDSLPVVGPVDSWIGLKMTNNWDNMLGFNLGVGIHARPTSDLPSRKDLCRILQFRAYAALQPLCTQRVGASSNLAATTDGRLWRQRDTDIEYSGAAAASMAVIRQR